ncbi:protein kinase domain-containing protein [Candidatus Frankia alpina]|uniref:protein kinase domain-containing protein n=1 Tax=Candidatus Frankia alpina TaxID=2699483 RepID=UPI001F171440|nr:protein kinase [Candidatus Frankia alpina]
MTAGTGDAVDRRVAGRYRLIEQLGAGAYGTVWRAFDEILGVTAAAKEVRISPAASLENTAHILARAEREARMVAKLRDHPNVVTVLDVVRDEGLPWIIMEFIPSVSLAEAIRARGAFPPGSGSRCWPRSSPPTRPGSPIGTSNLRTLSHSRRRFVRLGNCCGV